MTYYDANILYNIQKCKVVLMHWKGNEWSIYVVSKNKVGRKQEVLAHNVEQHTLIL
jgi:hypothetical protein